MSATPDLAAADPDHRIVWKAGAILATAEWGYNILHPADPDWPPLLLILSALAMAIGLLGAFQYAFAWPRLPRLVWRTVGLVVIVLVVVNAAQWLGWSGARLYSRPLGPLDQADTVFQMVRAIAEDMLVAIPLFRLGEWHRLSIDRPVPAARVGAPARSPARIVHSPVAGAATAD